LDSSSGTDGVRDLLSPMVFVLRKEGDEHQLLIGGGGEKPRLYKLTMAQVRDLCLCSMKLMLEDANRFSVSNPPPRSPEDP